MLTYLYLDGRDLPRKKWVNNEALKIPYFDSLKKNTEKYIQCCKVHTNTPLKKIMCKKVPIFIPVENRIIYLQIEKKHVVFFGTLVAFKKRTGGIFKKLVKPHFSPL